MSYKSVPRLLSQKRTLELVRSQLAEKNDAGVPPSHGDRSVESQYSHAAVLGNIIRYIDCGRQEVTLNGQHARIIEAKFRRGCTIIVQHAI
ncbi:hypothetical protein N7475_008839 [Penicillium sp. IBT 31633x]|nr:hypothetical protein N7475_008839 [Penicillium sp. IBT 31633x]